MSPIYTVTLQNTQREQRRRVLRSCNKTSACDKIALEIRGNPYWEVVDVRYATLQDFESELDKFDWAYVMSDDPHVYEQGGKRHRELREIAEMLGEDAQAAMCARGIPA